MRLDMIKGKGGVLVLRMSTGDGRDQSDAVVNDPANCPTPAVPLKDWIEGSGGIAPIGGLDAVADRMAGSEPAGGTTEGAGPV